MTVLLLFIAGFLTALLVLFSWVLQRKRKKDNNKTIPEMAPKLDRCPLCGGNLSGMKLYSKLIAYPDGRKMLEIRGCKRCYKSGGSVKKVCPSCKSKLALEDYVFASYEEKGAIKKVIIKGCRYCYKR